MYGIKQCIHTTNNIDVFVVGIKGFASQDDIAEFNADDARKRLMGFRRQYCLDRVCEIRKNRMYNDLYNL